MNRFGSLSSKKVFCVVVCILFLVASATPALSARKKPKRSKRSSATVTETTTTTPAPATTSAPETTTAPATTTAPTTTLAPVTTSAPATTESPAPAATEMPATTAESPAPAASGDVEVYAEGAYTTGDLTVYIYANIDVVLCSFGVALNYDSSKLVWTPPSAPVAEVNEAVWYMGTTGTHIPYMSPEISAEGKIIFIGAKLDTDDDPTPTGVTGERVLLGKVTFSRTETTNPGANPETYFGITLGLGRPDPNPPTITFDNFVTTTGTVEDDDGVSFTGLTIAERGDANADGIIDFQDMLAVQYYTQNGGPDNVYKNCNGDEVIDFQDMLCIQGKTQN